MLELHGNMRYHLYDTSPYNQSHTFTSNTQNILVRCIEVYVWLVINYYADVCFLNISRITLLITWMNHWAGLAVNDTCSKLTN